MNNIELKYTVKELTFKQALYTSQTTWSKRQVVFVGIRINDFIGYGEIAPLPGWGSENLEQVIHVLNSLKIQQFLADYPHNLNEIINISNAIFQYFPNAFATRCGLEMALLNILSRKEDINVLNFFGNSLRNKIPVAALVSGQDYESIIKQIDRAYKDNYRTVKIKADKEALNSIRHLFRIKARFPKLKIRLDFNSCLSSKEMVQFYDAALNLNPEYIEQPLPAGQESEMFKILRNFKIPTALDESIKSPEAAFFYLEYPEFYQVIKPMTFGGHLAVANFLKYAEAKRVKVVLSSAIESSLTGWYNIILAATVNNTMAQGLGTYSMISGDFTINPIEVKNGFIDLTQINNSTFELMENLKQELF